MSGPLAGKSALVTGGAAGMGLAAAELLARDGAVVTLMGRNAETLEPGRDAILKVVPDAKVAITLGDGTKEPDVVRAIEAARDAGGGLDIVVATVGRGTWGAIEQMSAEAFLADLQRNILSSFMVVHHGAPLMKNGGSFVFTSSTCAEMPVPNLSSYCAAKAGLDHFVRAAAIELGPRQIRLNAVRPGLTRTPGHEHFVQDTSMSGPILERTPLGRFGESMDVAGLMRFLAGPESSWITGQSIAVDGGNELMGTGNT